MGRIAAFIFTLALFGEYAFCQSAGMLDDRQDIMAGVNSELNYKAPSVSFISSNLPIFVITTENSQTIPDEPKITANLGVIYNGPGLRNNLTDVYNHYNGLIGIELRGNSSQNFPKKPYNFETRDSAGANLNVSFFGMPFENDWALIASYLDHTFARNLLATHMSGQTGRWASRGQLVELILNGQYQGIYILMERIKKDQGRLDIATLNPEEIYYPDITGGYIFEITGFESNFGSSRNLKYPEYDEAAPEQIAYIRQYDDNFRNVMLSANYMDPVTGYNAWIDVESFIIEIIIQEALRNSDAYGWSAYFHKDKDEKLKAGPVWDFDQSAGNSSYPDNGVITGWLFAHTSTSNTPFFWKLLFNDPVFSYKVRLRWEGLRAGPYSTSNLLTYIDSIANLLTEAQAREFAQWPVLGQYVWRETYGYQQRNTFQKEIDYLKSFLTQRWTWMDSELAKISNPTTAVPITFSGSDVDNLLIYPNPVKDRLTFEINCKSSQEAIINIYNLAGKLIQYSKPYNLSEGINSLLLELDNNTPAGVYLYKIFINTEARYIGKFIKQ